MSDMNEGIFSGRIAKVEVRRNNDLVIANLKLAVNYYDKKSKSEKPLYIPITVYGKEAEAIEKYQNVGDQLLVKGEWRPNEWQSKNGEKHYELRLSTIKVIFGRKKGDRTGNTVPDPMANVPQNVGQDMAHNPMDNVLEEDDLPF